MSIFWLISLVLLLALVGFVLGRRRAIASAAGDARKLHSLPKYYGSFVALCTLVPALLVTIVWMFVQPMVIERSITMG